MSLSRSAFSDDEGRGRAITVVDSPDKPSKFAKATKLVVHHITKHTGIGIVCAVAYFDPGNWGVDLQAGSQYGYRLLFVVLLAGLFAILLQTLASRLGCVTGLDLASHCRLLLHNRPKHKMLYRWGLLYPLYVLSEVAIIATDLAEMLGSAIALSLLFPKLQIWHGVLITCADVLLILFLGDPLKGKRVKSFEYLIGVLVIIVLVCMSIVIGKVPIDWGDAFFGYVPSKYIFPNGALYTSIGILGATVMPHSLFLGSSLATADRVTEDDTSSVLSTVSFQWTRESFLQLFRRGIRAVKDGFLYAIRAAPSVGFTESSHAERENHSYHRVTSHLWHGVVDMAVSLLGFAVVINSMILILASAVFFYGNTSTSDSGGPADLFDAYDLIKTYVGQASATIFALALLSAGQSSSIIATVAGQAVAEGFLRWAVSPALRRLFTRLIAVIPSMIVAIVMGRPGISSLLVASQVVLSVCLPFITLPLIILTSSKTVMRVRKPEVGEDPSSSAVTLQVAPTDEEKFKEAVDVDIEARPVPKDEYVDFSNSRPVKAFAIAIWIVVVAANVYMLVTLGTGE